MTKETEQAIITGDYQRFLIGGFDIELLCPPDVMEPSPYSKLLASCIPTIEDGAVIDIGTGSGALAIVALLRGASSAYLSDISHNILYVAESNIRKNVPQAKVYSSLPSGGKTLPDELPPKVGLILCNPPSLPQPPNKTTDSTPYASGDDGRRIIEQMLMDISPLLRDGARLMFAHTSLANITKTLELLTAYSLQCQTLISEDYAFRPFYNRSWIDSLGGVDKGLYKYKDGLAFEQVKILEVTTKAD